MVRNELWNDSPESLDRRLAIFAVIAFALSGLWTSSFTPSPPTSPSTSTRRPSLTGQWERPLLVQDFPVVSMPPTAREGRQEVVELALEVEGACNSARQKAKLKRRWPLREIQVLVTESKPPQMEKAKDLVSLLCNVKKVSVDQEGLVPADLGLALARTVRRSAPTSRRRPRPSSRPSGGSRATRHGSLPGRGAPSAFRPIRATVDVPVSTMDFSFQGTGDWEAVARDGIMIALEKVRDDKLIAEGLLRDIARRLQALRKARGYSPTAVLEKAMVAGLDEEMTSLLRPLAGELELPRPGERSPTSWPRRPTDGEWEEDELDGRPIYIDVSGSLVAGEEAAGKGLREAGLDNLRSRPLDVVLDGPMLDGDSDLVDLQERVRARLSPVAGLPDRAGVEDRPLPVRPDEGDVGVPQRDHVTPSLCR